MTEEIIIDGVNVAGCEYYIQDYQRANNIEGRYEHCKDVCELNGDNYFYCKMNNNCYYKQLKRLEQENKKLSKLIRGTKDYAEVCSVCKDEVTIYPNISGRTDYTQNEVECRTLARIIIRKNNLEQENKELKEKNATLEDKLQLRMASDKESDAFWDEIFSEKDYPFNKENAYKELSDYYFVLEQLPKIYMEITGGTLSKTTYFASSVVEAYNDSLDRYYEKIDNVEYDNNASRSALEEIKAMINHPDHRGLLNRIEDKINEVLNG